MDNSVRGSVMGTSLAPSFSYSLSAPSTAARTSGARPSPKNSAGMPMRRPSRRSFSPALKFSLGMSRLVESRSRSGPHMAESSKAQSSALRAMGPAWSRLEAKAIMP
ncbi:hypothetical protein D3C71_1770120 [compost metagenome]